MGRSGKAERGNGPRSEASKKARRPPVASNLWPWMGKARDVRRLPLSFARILALSCRPAGREPDPPCTQPTIWTSAVIAVAPSMSSTMR